MIHLCNGTCRLPGSLISALAVAQRINYSVILSEGEQKTHACAKSIASPESKDPLGLIVQRGKTKKFSSRKASVPGPRLK
jgi:hypothetical protein